MQVLGWWEPQKDRTMWCEEMTKLFRSWEVIEELFTSQRKKT